MKKFLHKLKPYAFSIFLALTASPSQAQFTAVSAGDMTSNAVVLWTQYYNAGASSALTLQVATDPSFSNILGNYNNAQVGNTVAGNDFTLKYIASQLSPNTQYFYRFSQGAVSSDTGRFVTNPSANTLVPFKVGFSADYDAKYRPYSVLGNFGTSANPGSIGLNAFINLGDLIYETTAKGSPGVNALTPSSSPAQVDAALPAYYRKYVEGLRGVTSSGAMSDQGLQGMRSMLGYTGVYSLLDNHELNGAMISGGASQTSLKENMSLAEAVNRTGSYINQTDAFKMMSKTFYDTHATAVQINGAAANGYDFSNSLTGAPSIYAPGDSRTNGTAQNFFSRQWGQAASYIQLDDRSYRDARMGSDTFAFAPNEVMNNPARTMLGSTQLNWFKQQLLSSRNSGSVWTVIAVSTPIDQWNLTDNKSWVAGYGSERNDIMKFIVDQKIKNVIFLTADDHMSRVTQLRYQPEPIKYPELWLPVPGAFQILSAPAGAVGPYQNAIDNMNTFGGVKDFSLNRSQQVLDLQAKSQGSSALLGVGLMGLPGLANVYRAGDPGAASNPKPIDFFTATNFGYSTLAWDRFGNLTVQYWGVDGYDQNTYPSTFQSPSLIMSFSVHVPYTINVGNFISLTDADQPHFNSNWTVNGGLDISGSTTNASFTGISGIGSIALGNQRLILTNAADIFSGTISGTGGLTLEAGAFQLSGSNTYTGSTIVNGGELKINGSITSAVTVNAGAVLSGTGTIAGAWINSGGRFAPGNSIGTMTSNGNVTFNSGSIYEVQTNPYGQSDKILVNGTAVLKGGMVQVNAEYGGYRRNSIFNIINAASGVAGEFTGVNSNFAFLVPSLSYDANNVYLNLTRNSLDFVSIAASSNEKNLARVLDPAYSFYKSGSALALFDSLETLSVGQVKGALSALSGEGLVASQSSVYVANNFLLDSIRQESNAQGLQMMDTKRGWATIYGANTAMSASVSSGVANANLNNWGLVAGHDYAVQSNFRVGAVLGAATSNFTVADRNTSGTISGGQLGLYGTAIWDSYYLTGVVAYGQYEAHTSRSLQIGDLNSSLKASFGIGAPSARLEFGQNFKIQEDTYLTPFAAVQVTGLFQQGFNEKNQGANFGLTVPGQTSVSTPASLGMQIAGKYKLENGGSFLPVVRAAWVHDFTAERSFSNMNLSALPGAGFDTYGLNGAKDAARLSLNLTIEDGQGLSAFISGTAEISSNVMTYGASVGLKYVW